MIMYRGRKYNFKGFYKKLAFLMSLGLCCTYVGKYIFKNKRNQLKYC